MILIPRTIFKNTRIAGSVLFLLIFPAVCLAQIEIKAEVDKQKITTDDELVYKLIISSADEPIPRPKFPDFKSFLVASQANTSDINIKGNSNKIGAIYVFILIPKEAGKFTIEPTEIKTKKATYKSESFQIEVVQGERKLVPSEPPKDVPEIPQEESPKEKVLL